MPRFLALSLSPLHVFFHALCPSLPLPPYTSSSSPRCGGGHAGHGAYAGRTRPSAAAADEMALLTCRGGGQPRQKPEGRLWLGEVVFESFDVGDERQTPFPNPYESSPSGRPARTRHRRGISAHEPEKTRPAFSNSANIQPEARLLESSEDLSDFHSSTQAELATLKQGALRASVVMD